MISKEKIRRQALKERNAMEEKWRLENSQAVLNQVRASEPYRRAKIVLSYCSVRSEVETGTLNEAALRDGKRLYLPRVNEREKTMSFHEADDLKKLHKGPYGIPEPEEAEALEPVLEAGEFTREEVLMIMPCVTFDGKGNRMGYGGGFYDRYLSQYGGFLTTLMIAFKEQQSFIVPTERNDVKPDYLMTQDGEWRQEI